MSRDTEITKLQFPVYLKPVYAEGSYYNPLKNFYAVSGMPEGTERIFTVVSKNYSLITNEEAIAIGKKIFSEVFPATNSDDFVVFNMNFPSTKSYCNIDLINKNYSFNVWEKEVFIPFIRVTNSYNKSKKLKYELGFSRMLCNNGVIFEKEIVELQYSHYNNSAESIKNNLKSQIDFKRLKSLEKEFIEFMKKLNEVRISKKYHASLTAKIFGIKFDTDSGLKKQRDKEIQKKKEFIDCINTLSEDYMNKLGENAYCVFNIATAFANERKFVTSSMYNGYQSKAGNWLKEFVKIENKKMIYNYLEESLRLFN